MENWIKNYIQEHTKIISELDQKKLYEFIEMLKLARDQGKNIFIIGNGGDAACSSHLTVDLGKGASINREKKFKVFSLVDNIPWVTALANDTGYENIFIEQIKNFSNEGDVVLAFSVSGSSSNLVKAVEFAKKHKLKTIAVIGDHKGKLTEMVDLPIVIPSKHYGHVEDIQALICHIISYYFIENEQGI